MKKRGLAAVVVGVALLLLAWAFIFAPKHPVALIRVIDGAGNPVRNAIIVPDGMRTKTGPYQSGHFGWARDTNGPPAEEARTDANGVALVPYPKYVFERIETGEISFSVVHPEFVPDRPFRVVNTAPPAGAPWKERFSYVVTRIRQRTLVARTDPVILERGAIVKLTRAGQSTGTNRVFAQFSGVGANRVNFWTNPAPGVVLSRQVKTGAHLARILEFDGAGRPRFSEVVPVEATTNNAVEISLELQPGVALLGELDPTVPRPVTRGRVIVHVTPSHTALKDHPPEWHAWTETKPDGSFQFDSLPAGKIEISAICDGFISTNGTGRSSQRSPQQHQLGANDLSIVIGMEPTARLEVKVTDDQGRPVPDAAVITWPNIRYGDWSSTIFADCYNTADHLKQTAIGQLRWGLPVPDFQGTSDSNGLAILPNLPANVREFAVQHAAFHLPAVNDGTGRKSREAPITLLPGQTNRITVRLEPVEASQISHY